MSQTVQFSQNQQRRHKSSHRTQNITPNNYYHGNHAQNNQLNMKYNEQDQQFDSNNKQILQQIGQLQQKHERNRIIDKSLNLSQEYQQQKNFKPNNKMIFAQPNITFFQEIYANYTQIWQSVLKLTLINNSLVDLESFEKILSKVGIEVNNQYCQFLLETCQKPISMNENQNYQNIKQKEEDKLIDYKFFLNSAIKALSLESFDNETFILEQFWKTKFGDQTNQRQITIEEFNQAFYQFFNKENRLLSIDFIDQIINECFSYLLKKNKKFISKRSFRKVVKRNFKDIFNLILFNLSQKAQRKSQHQQLSANKQQELKQLPTSDIIANCIQTTYYPDSLDMRSMLNPSKPNLITTQNQSKSLYETSTFYNYSNNGNNRSKSSEMVQNPSYQPVIAHNSSLHQQSTFDALAQKVGLLAEKTYDSRGHATKYLELTIQKVIRQYHLRTGLEGLREFKVRGSRRPKQKFRNKLSDKENVNLQDTNNTQASDSYYVQVNDKQMKSKKQTLLERQTFSFQNKTNRLNKDEQIEKAYDSYQRNLEKSYKNSMSDDKNLNNQLEINTVGSYNTVANKLQSYVSLQYSNSPSQMKYSHYHNKSREIPISTKSYSISEKPITNYTERQQNYQRSDTQRVQQYPPLYPQQNYYSERDLDNVNLRQSRTEVVNTEQTDSSIDIKTQATTNLNSRRMSQNLIPRSQKNNSFKNLVKANFQNQSNNIHDYDNQNNLYQPMNFSHGNSHQQQKHQQEFNQYSNRGQQMVKSLDRHPLNDISQSTLTYINTSNTNISTFNRKHSTGHIRNSNQNLEQNNNPNLHLINDDSQLIIANVTPITNKNSIQNHASDQHSTSISKMMDLHTLQTGIAQSQYQKPKELVHIERKYRKSKEKIRTLLTENANEKTKNQALQKCNFVLGEKVEQLENQYSDITKQLLINQEQNAQIVGQIGYSKQQSALNIIYSIIKKKNAIIVQKQFKKWVNVIIQEKYTKIQVQKLSKQSQQKFLQQYLQAWIKYCLNRQTRKEHRKFQKLQQKVLKNIMRRRILIQKRKTFNFWKGPFIKSFMIEEVQRDMQYAHQQVKTMRFIMSISKLNSLIQRKEQILKSQTLSHIFRFDRALQTIQYCQDQQSEYENINFHPNHTMVHTHKSPFNQTFQLQPQHTLYTARQQLNYNNQDQQHTQFYKIGLNQQQHQLQQTTDSNGIQLTNILTNNNNNTISQYQNNNNIFSGQTSPFVQKNMTIFSRSNEKSTKTDYTQKAMQQRKQQKIIEGIEKLYFVNRKQSKLLKEQYFYTWKQICQDEQEIHYLQEQESKEYILSPQQIYNDISGDLDISQDYQSTSQFPAPQDPCYYKTNEGYFYPLQKQLQQPNFTTFNNDPNQNEIIEPISPINYNSQSHSNYQSQTLQQLQNTNYAQAHQQQKGMLNVQLNQASHNNSQAQNNFNNCSNVSLTPQQNVPKPYPLSSNQIPRQQLSNSNQKNNNNGKVRILSQNSMIPINNGSATKIKKLQW